MLKLMLMVFAFLFVVATAYAGILPPSRGGTGANLTPSANKVVTSSSSALQLSSSIVLPAGGTISIPAGASTASGAPLYIAAGTTLSVKEPGAIESNGTRLYWTNSAGARFFFNFTAQ